MPVHEKERGRERSREGEEGKRTQYQGGASDILLESLLLGLHLKRTPQGWRGGLVVEGRYHSCRLHSFFASTPTRELTAAWLCSFRSDVAFWPQRRCIH